MSSNIRTAQFGGVGGGGSGSPFSPGKSPIGTGGRNSGGYQINMSWDEENNMEKMLSRTHDEIDMSDRNIESRHSFMHSNPEELKNYVLTPEERRREKFRAKLHQYKEQLEEEAKHIDKNSVQYIKEHFPTKPEHAITLEERLKERRKMKDDPKLNKYEFEDKLPDLIKPTRSHPILSDRQMNRIALIVMRDKITHEEDEEERNVYDVKRYSDPPIGKTPRLLEGTEINEYFNELLKQYNPDPEGLTNEDVFLDYPDRDTLPNVHTPDEIAKEPADDGVFDIDVFKPLETNLHPSKMPKNMFDRNNMGGEDMGIEETYPGSAFFGIHSPASFK